MQNEPTSTQDPADELADALPSPAPQRPPPPEDAHPGPGAVDSFLRRGIAGVAGLALVVGFFLDWQQATGINSESYTGLQLVLKGEVDQGQKIAVAAVPVLGALLIALGYWGRRPALIGALLVGLVLLLIGTWQTLLYLALSIGPGLWVTAGAAFLALLGGIPWKRIARGMRSP